MPDAWRRYQVASEISFHHLAIETLIELRHRRGLMEYMGRPDIRRSEHVAAIQLAEAALRNPVQKRMWGKHSTMRIDADDARLPRP